MLSRAVLRGSVRWPLPRFSHWTAATAPSQSTTAATAARTSAKPYPFPFNFLLRRFDNNSAFMCTPRTIPLPGATVSVSLATLSCHASFCVLALSYLHTDMMVLRILATAGILGTSLFQFFRIQPLWLPLSWNLVFIVINVAMLIPLLEDRREAMMMDADSEELYTRAFQPVGMKKPDFARMLRAGEWQQLPPGSLVRRQGEPGTDLLLLADGVMSVKKEEQGTVAYVGRGQMIGEMAFMADNPCETPATATVSTATAVKAFVWPYEQLEALMSRRPQLAAAIKSAISRDLQSKVQTSTADLQSTMYWNLVHGVLADNVISAEERTALDVFRVQQGVSHAAHVEALRSCGWSEEEYVRGRRSHRPAALGPEDDDGAERGGNPYDPNTNTPQL